MWTFGCYNQVTTGKKKKKKSEGADLLQASLEVERLFVMSVLEQPKPFSSALIRIYFNQEEISDQEINLKIKWV